MKLAVQANGVCIGWLSLDAISALVVQPRA